MTAGAAPVAGRRASLGAAVLLAGYLLLGQQLYLLGPLALLTLFSRPRTVRELIWLGLASAGAAATLTGDQTLVPQLLRTGGLVMGVAFALLSLRGSTTLVSRLLWALVLTLAGLIVWGKVWGVTWTAVEGAFVQLFQGMYTEWAKSRPGDLDFQLLMQQSPELSRQAARLFPGVLALQGMAGCALAWDWHHRVAVTPLGRAPGRFKEFRFNDHLVWGAIFTLGLMLLPLPPLAGLIAANLLIVWIGLYTMRGLAVIAAVFEPAPALWRFVAMALASPICAVLGLADTWLDFRGRLAPPAPGGA